MSITFKIFEPVKFTHTSKNSRTQNNIQFKLPGSHKMNHFGLIIGKLK